jgi:hypothetical protein
VVKDDGFPLASGKPFQHGNQVQAAADAILETAGVGPFGPGSAGGGGFAELVDGEVCRHPGDPPLRMVGDPGPGAEGPHRRLGRNVLTPVSPKYPDGDPLGSDEQLDEHLVGRLGGAHHRYLTHGRPLYGPRVRELQCGGGCKPRDRAVRWTCAVERHIAASPMPRSRTLRIFSALPCLGLEQFVEVGRAQVGDGGGQPMLEGRSDRQPQEPGAREENRTPDLRITSALLCRLSYPGLPAETLSRRCGWGNASGNSSCRPAQPIRSEWSPDRDEAGRLEPLRLRRSGRRRLGHTPERRRQGLAVADPVERRCTGSLAARAAESTQSPASAYYGFGPCTSAAGSWS